MSMLQCRSAVLRGRMTLPGYNNCLGGQECLLACDSQRYAEQNAAQKYRPKAKQEFDLATHHGWIVGHNVRGAYRKTLVLHAFHRSRPTPVAPMTALF
jgi:hypothetical protein